MALTQDLRTRISGIRNSINTVLGNIENDSVFDSFKIESLEATRKRLDHLEELLSVSKHKLVFVGTVGSGKTTAICNLFNLVEEKPDSIEMFGKEFDAIKIEPILDTGSGRTTLCEVELVPSTSTTSIEIDPYSKDELKALIEEFAFLFYDDLEENEGQEGSYLPKELVRAVRNMTGLTFKVDDGATIDLAKQLAEGVPRDTFIQRALKAAKLEGRHYSKERSVLKHSIDEQIGEKKWLKKYFGLINKGNLVTHSIPKRIVIKVGPNIHGDSGLKLFSKVVDTKGIDENPNRPDLKDYIESNDSLVVFTSRFNDAPEANIFALSKYYLSQESKKYADKFSVMVLPRKEEPENENDGDGTWDGGVDSKRQTIIEAYNNENYTFKKSNILFYDSHRYFEIGNFLAPTRKNDKIEDSSIKINSISEIISSKNQVLAGELDTIEENIERTENLEDISEAIVEAIEWAKKNIQIKKEVGSDLIKQDINLEFIRSYVDNYSHNYKAWNTKDAIHRRHGYFPARGFDTYYDGRIVAEGKDKNSMLRGVTQQVKEKVLEELTSLSQGHNALNSIIPEIKKSFIDSYDQFISDTGTHVQKFMETNNTNPEFWKDMINRRGQGPGFNDYVLNDLGDKLRSRKSSDDLNVEQTYKKIATENWEKAMNKLLHFFEKR